MNLEHLQKWFADNGDNTLRLNYNLNESSVVLDLGGYKGDWTSSIYNKYSCNIFVFEPIPFLYDKLVDRFDNLEKIKVFNFGISDESKNIQISVAADGSSFYIDSNHKVDCVIKPIDEVIYNYNLNEVDLIKINIEGDEFPVLEKLIDTGLVTRIKNIQVQFHQFIPNSVEKRKSIRDKLSLTHKLTYDYEFVWENWEKL